MHYFNLFGRVLFEHYWDLSGRASREEFWSFYLLSSAILIISGFFLGIALVPMVELLGEALQLLILIPFAILNLAFFPPLIGVSVRRLHDTGHSGWWLLLLFVPAVNFIGLVVLLYFVCSKGESTGNQYG